MRNALLSVLALLSLLPNLAMADAEAIETLVENTYRNAVVKIDVSSNTAVIRNNQNICHSEGTGFLVNKTDVVTAAHVFDLDKACGERIIFVKSRKHKLKALAKVIASADDVAVLRIEPTKAFGYVCALILMPPGSSATRGFRYGIPDGMEDPDPVSLTIGESDNQFKPLFILKPAITHPGESGGPVLRQFNVVGITKSRLEKFPDVSFMISSEAIIKVLVANKISYGDVCNPAVFATTRPIPAPDQGEPPADPPDDIQGSIFNKQLGYAGQVAIFNNFIFPRKKYQGEFDVPTQYAWDRRPDTSEKWLQYEFRLGLPDGMSALVKTKFSSDFGAKLTRELSMDLDPKSFIVDMNTANGAITVRSRAELQDQVRLAVIATLGKLRDEWWNDYTTNMK